MKSSNLWKFEVAASGLVAAPLGQKANKKSFAVGMTVVALPTMAWAVLGIPRFRQAP